MDRGATTRAAGRGDLAAIARIERDAFSDPWSERSFASLVDAPHVAFLVAVDAITQEVQGYVLASRAADEAEIVNIAVAPLAQRQGIGARLLDEMLEELRRRGVRSVFLDVRESNWPARSLYRSRQFEVIGRRRRYYRRPAEDALVMRREL